MPESVRDRCTRSHEQVFMLTKAPRYFYDAEALAESAKDWTAGGPGTGIKPTHHYGAENGGNEGLAGIAARYKAGEAPTTRNRRSVWTLGPEPFPEAHFAVMPSKLARDCVLAGSAPKVCGECGAPWERVVERTPMVVEPSARRDAAHEAGVGRGRTATSGTMTQAPTSETVGWRSTCEHDDDSGKATVLDPFAGAGTTGYVALDEGRHFIGCELNADYADLMRRRLGRVTSPLF